MVAIWEDHMLDAGNHSAALDNAQIHYGLYRLVLNIHQLMNDHWFTLPLSARPHFQIHS